MAGILNHQMTAGQALTGQGAAPMASGTTGTSSAGSAASSSDSSGDSATISANDFLTLLVTEMQNQDPTANTDPNEYINQLVSVNSLEQLIDINQTLSTVGGTTSGSSGSSATPGATAAPSSLTAKPASGATAHVQAATRTAGGLAAMPRAGSSTSQIPAMTSAAKRAPGNLSIPTANPAASRVAHALSGRTHAQSIAGGLSGAQ